VGRCRRGEGGGGGQYRRSKRRGGKWEGSGLSGGKEAGATAIKGIVLVGGEKDPKLSPSQIVKKRV